MAKKTVKELKADLKMMKSVEKAAEKELHQLAKRSTKIAKALDKSRVAREKVEARIAKLTPAK